MGYGQGKCLNKNNLSTAGESTINLGAPSSETLRKLQSAYTWESGDLKFLSLSHYKLCECSYDSKVKPLFLIDNFKVNPATFGNGVTIQFDERAKVNI